MMSETMVNKRDVTVGLVFGCGGARRDARRGLRCDDG